MSLQSTMSGGKSRKRVSVKDIRVNPLNWYRPYNVDELAVLIERDGQLENGTVYEEEKENDEKKYTLIGGYRRFLAISLLYEQGRGDGLMDVTVVQKPDNEYDEKSLIQSDNAQRLKTQEEIKEEIQCAVEKWDYLCSIDRKPVLENGIKKRDWIGEQVGLKGRQVQEYLTGRLSDSQDSSASDSGEDTPIHENTEEDIQKSLKKALKALLKAEEISEELNRADIGTAIVRIKEELDEVIGMV